MIFKGVLAMLALSGAASADVPDSAIAACAALADQGPRLECFDAIAESLTRQDAATLSPTPASPGKWQVDHSKNPLDDTETVVATLVADSGASAMGSAVVLFVRCQSGQTEVYITWNDYLASDGDYDSGYKTVVTRIGAQPARTGRWTTSTDQTATFAPDALPLLQKMADASSFVAQVTPYNASPITAVFDLSGIRDALQPVSEVCRWRLDPPASPQASVVPAPPPSAVPAPRKRPRVLGSTP